ncbi:MAG: dipeptidase [Arenicella sp.]
MAKPYIKRILAGIIGLAVLVVLILHYVVLPYVDSSYNRVVTTKAIKVTPQTREFHEKAFIADLHADSLLWARDLRVRYQRGHVDLPRLKDGAVDLQVFSVVTRVPKKRNYHSTPDVNDSLPLLFFAAWRSPVTWFSARFRALAQAEELRQLTSETELNLVLDRKSLNQDGPKALLALEGMHALEGRESALQQLHAAGYRMMGLAHHFDNDVAGSAHGVEKYGLTPFGQKMVEDMQTMGITIDLAHASRQAFDDALEIAGKPVVVSHGGVQGTCPGPRNLSDNQLRRIAQNTGVVGIGYWKGATCDNSVQGIVAAILHVIEVAGIDTVALGSDFDGNVSVPFDVADLSVLTQALFEAGLSHRDVEKVLGGNVRRVLEMNLPDSSATN